jgi:hypothetical protein
MLPKIPAIMPVTLELSRPTVPAHDAPVLKTVANIVLAAKTALLPSFIITLHFINPLRVSSTNKSRKGIINYINGRRKNVNRFFYPHAAYLVRLASGQPPNPRARTAGILAEFSIPAEL